MGINATKKEEEEESNAQQKSIGGEFMHIEKEGLKEREAKKKESKNRCLRTSKRKNGSGIGRRILRSKKKEQGQRCGRTSKKSRKTRKHSAKNSGGHGNLLRHGKAVAERA